MSISDASFREAFKPVHIAAHYDAGNSDADKIVYALAQLGAGTATAVADKLAELDLNISTKNFLLVVESVLTDLYNKGLIKGLAIDGKMHYNLSKITEANDGAINPNLLAPGLD